MVLYRRPGLSLLPLLIALLLAGCSYEAPGAVGSNGDVSVFMNIPRGGGVERAVRRVFGHKVNTVFPETAYYLDFVSFSEKYGVHRHFKNHLYLVNLSRDDRLSRTVPGLIGVEGRRRMGEGKPFRLLVRDLHAVGQTALFLVGRSEEDLLGLLPPSEEAAIRREFERAVVEGLVHTNYSLGEELELPQEVAARFGWTLRLPEGYYGAVDAANRFVKFNAASPVRLVLVHWMDEVLPLSAEAWNPIMDRVLFVYNDGDVVEPENTVSYPYRFQGGPAMRWEGVWQNEKYVIGGAFRAVAFTRDDRSYLMLAMVYIPAQDKLPTLRQVDAVLETFRETE
jgi:hypothetical protein